MKRCGIYLITHIASGTQYVGQSRDIDKRWYLHSRGLCKMKLGRAIACYGWHAFSAEILELCAAEQLNATEASWILKLDTLAPRGYNLTSGGGQPTFHSPETLLKMSLSKQGGRMSAETKLKMSAIGKARSSEYRAKIAAANSRRVVTDETRAKLTAAKLKQSDETKAKIGAAFRGKKCTPEHIANAVAGKSKQRLLREA